MPTIFKHNMAELDRQQLCGSCRLLYRLRTFGAILRQYRRTAQGRWIVRYSAAQREGMVRLPPQSRPRPRHALDKRQCDPSGLLHSRRGRGSSCVDARRDRSGNHPARAGPRRSRLRRLYGVLHRPHRGYARFQEAGGNTLLPSRFARVQHPCAAPPYLPDMVLRLAQDCGHAR